MSKQKIGIIHDCLHIGGTEKALLTMLKFFDYSKYDVTLWLMNDNGGLQSELDKRVNVCYFSNDGYSGRSLIKNYIKNGQIVRLIEALRYRQKSRQTIDSHYDNLKYAIYSLPLVTNEEYDCLVVYQGLYMQLLASALGRFKAKKKAAWIHMCFNHNKQQIESFDPVYKEFDRIYCVSQDIRDHFVSIYGMPEKTEVFYNCFDTEDIRSKAEEQVDWNYNGKSVLTTVGRISKEKGQMMIPAVAKKLKDRGYRFVWLVVGDGAEKDRLSKEINKFHLEKDVLLLGSKSNPYPYIKNCTIYVQPSYTEGFCTSTMEAKILGKPIVATNVSGMNEQFIDGYDGVLVDDITPDGILKKLWPICSSNELQLRLSENAFKSVSKNYADLHKIDELIEGDLL